jgi:O-acetyl-ADP-ribose deacetylase (regulator of RNase III)
MKTIKGDLIKLAEDGEFDIIIQGCNCFHTMGSGIAGQLATKYPEVLEADKETIYGERVKLGSWSHATINTQNHKFNVVNAYTQHFFGLVGKDVFEYEAFEVFLNTFSQFLSMYSKEFDKSISIGFPMIGAGLAGGDWRMISMMIEQFAKDVEPYADVTIVEYQP